MSEIERKNTRFQANFDGAYRFKGAKDWNNCYIYDISETGALLRVKQTLIPGDNLEICLDIENYSNTISAVVANSNGQVAGVQFKSSGIEEYINKTIDKAFEHYRNKKKV